MVDDRLTGGATHVVDCVGSGDSLQQALDVVGPGGTVHAVGMPGVTTLDLTGLWHREISLRGLLRLRPRPTSTIAMRLVRELDLGRLVTATYPCPATRTPSPTPPTPAAAAPSRSPSTSARRRSATACDPATLRPTVPGGDFSRTLGDVPPPEGRSELMPRPGFVLQVDSSTPPILFSHGERFRLERLPAERSRVIYPPEPIAPLRDPDAAIRDALLNPLDSEPLPELLHAGMKLTIAFDDVSLPLPPMRRPDNRQRVIEAVLDMAAAAGVDDIHLIAALALHRRMTEEELRHAVGDRVYDAFAPTGRIYNHDAEDPDGMLEIGTTKHGELVEINKRAAESDLLIYVNVNLVSMDGGWKSTATGLAGYRSLKQHHNPATMTQSKSFMDRHKSELHHSNWRMGEVLKADGPRIFQIETTLNNDTYPAPVRLPHEAGVGVDGQGPGALPRHRQEPRAAPRRRWPARSSTRSGRRTA